MTLCPECRSETRDLLDMSGLACPECERVYPRWATQKHYTAENPAEYTAEEVSAQRALYHRWVNRDHLTAEQQVVYHSFLGMPADDLCEFLAIRDVEIAKIGAALYASGTAFSIPGLGEQVAEIIKQHRAG